jgi:hypothetical protein
MIREAHGILTRTLHQTRVLNTTFLDAKGLTSEYSTVTLGNYVKNLENVEHNIS